MIYCDVLIDISSIKVSIMNIELQESTTVMLDMILFV